LNAIKSFKEHLNLPVKNKHIQVLIKLEEARWLRDKMRKKKMYSKVISNEIHFINDR